MQTMCNEVLFKILFRITILLPGIIEELVCNLSDNGCNLSGNGSLLIGLHVSFLDLLAIDTHVICYTLQSLL
jgi:actin-like ATPase involved in cell morphogenesis